MFRIKYILITIAFALAQLPLQAQVSVEVRIDSTRIFIGQRVGVTVEVTADSKSKVDFPKYDSLQQVVPGVEVLNVSDADTNFINDRKRMTLKRKYMLTSFDSSLYYLPPFKVKVDGKDYETKNLALKVYTMNIDTLHTDSIFGIKPVMTPPFEWAEWKQLIWLSVIVFVLAMVLIYVVVRLKDNKPIIRRIRLKPRVIPHKEAMKKIEQIKEAKIWQKEDSKEYYTLLTDALRQYMNDRYGFNAMEMTTYEIIHELQNVNDEDAIRELRELFETADLVKFAKYNTMINENDRNLVYAIEYINQTKQEETAAPQPEEILVEEKSSKTAKMVMIACVVVTAIALTGVVGYLVYRMYFLNM